MTHDTYIRIQSPLDALTNFLSLLQQAVFCLSLNKEMDRTFHSKLKCCVTFTDMWWVADYTFGHYCAPGDSGNRVHTHHRSEPKSYLASLRRRRTRAA